MFNNKLKTLTTYLMLLLLMVANLLFVGNPYWFSLLRLGLELTKYFNILI